MKRTIRLKESELRHMIAESVKRVLRESDAYIPSWKDNLATTADEMKYWGFDKESNMIEKYLNKDGGKTCNMDVLNIIEDVRKIAVEKYESGEAANWDDYDDFIDLLNQTIKSYIDYCEAF